MGYKGEYVMAPTYPGSVGRRCPDISKARQHLGYAPKVEWQEGLKRTVEWYVAYFAANKSVGNQGFKGPERFSKPSVES